jgi:glycerol-3-phosphate cytidylyltransferase
MVPLLQVDHQFHQITGETMKRLISVSRRLRRRRRGPGVTGLAFGVFDFCHVGHRRFLEQAASSCDQLIVAVHPDEVVREYKGVAPANSLRERMRSVESLGIADVVVQSGDREKLCREHGVARVYHGDDWERSAYLRHFGADLVERLGLEVIMVPHTAGISSTDLRRRVPRIGWWLYPSLKDQARDTFFDHLKGLHAQLGGTWFVCSRGQRLVREHFPDAPRVWLDDRLDKADAARWLKRYDLDLIVTASFDYDPMVEVLQQMEDPPELVVVSHGRSGKPGASGDALVERATHGGEVGPAGAHTFQRGRVRVHDWSYDADSYCHLDAFLAAGGRFTNPVPVRERPLVLVLPTWCWGDPDDSGLLLGRRWHEAFRAIGEACDVLLSPHTFSSAKDVEAFRRVTDAEVLPATGRSYEHIPRVHVVVSDLSGVFWEALLFDTPVILADHDGSVGWSPSQVPPVQKVREVVPFAAPRHLSRQVLDAIGRRHPEQRPLAEARLGKVDGQATVKTAERIRELLRQRERRRAHAES